MHDFARKECAPDCAAALYVLCPNTVLALVAVAVAGVWANGAWYCGSIKFILSVGIKIKMLVIFLAFLFSCLYPSFYCTQLKAG